MYQRIGEARRSIFSGIRRERPCWLLSYCASPDMISSGVSKECLCRDSWDLLAKIDEQNISLQILHREEKNIIGNNNYDPFAFLMDSYSGTWN